MELLVRLPPVKQVTKRHEPHLLLRAAELAHPVIDEPGKQLFVAYPACAFFPASSSLRMYRAVPRYMASMIAPLYFAKSAGEVRNHLPQMGMKKSNHSIAPELIVILSVNS